MNTRAISHTPLYIDSREGIERFFRSIATPEIVAFDTEGASFHRFVDRIYLMQLSTREVTAVIDPLPIGKPAGLGALLEDPKVEVVFHDADYDLRLLHQDYGLHVTNVFDTRIAAQLLGLKAIGLAALLDRYFGVRLDKKHQRADWSMRPLSTEMFEYAALDTMYLLQLSDRMRAELVRVGRMEWAREEFQRLEGVRWDADDSGDGYLKTKGVRDLTRRELALFRELARWRDDVARQMDRATFRVASNEVLLEASRTAPQSTERLAAIRGMPRGMLERRGHEMLAAIRRGLAVAESELPRFPRAHRWDRDPEFEENVSRLKRVRDDAAHRLGMDPGFLCSRDRLEAIARRKPGSVDDLSEIKELRRWQIGEMGEHFVRALGGK